MLIQKLNKKVHNREAFDCGVEDFNAFLTKQASQYDKKGWATTYVVVYPSDPSVILCYFCISNHSIASDQLPGSIVGGIPEIPFTLLGRIALDKKVQGRGLFVPFLSRAFLMAYINSKEVASAGLIVDAYTKELAAWYEREVEFVPFPDNPNRLVLSMKEIGRILKAADLI